MRLIPLNNLILVKRDEAQEQVGGIYVVEQARDIPTKGVVVEVGENVKSKFLVKGAVILFSKYSGSKVEFENKEYLLMGDKEVLAVLEEEEEVVH